MTPDLFSGERVRLTPLIPDDAVVIARWYATSEFARLFDTSPARPRSSSEVARDYKLDNPDKDAYPFAIRPIDSNDLIGLIEIDGIEWNHRTGWIAIGIGEPAQRGQGYGYEAMELLLRFAFHELNLYRVQLNVFSYNTPAIALYRKVGFVQEGVSRESIERGGQRHDVVMFGMLRREWEARRQAHEHGDAGDA